MEINKEILLSVLDKVMPAVVKTELSILNCFLFYNNRVYAYNGEMLISNSLPFNFFNEGFAVKSKELYTLLKKIPDESVEMTIIEESLQVKTKNITANIQIILGEGFLRDIRELENIEWKEAPDTLYKGFEMCYLPDNEFSFAGICVEKNKMMSINGLVCGIFYLDRETNDFWIDDNAIKTILKIFPEKIEGVSSTGSWICFKKGDLIFSCRKIEDMKYLFEKFESLFIMYEKRNSDIDGVFPNTFIEAIDRASLFAYQEKILSVNFSDGKIICSSDNTKSSFKEVIEYKNKDVTFEMNIDCSYIQYALKRSLNFYLKDRNNDGEEKGTHIIFHTNNYKLIIKAMEKR